MKLIDIAASVFIILILCLSFYQIFSTIQKISIEINRYKAMRSTLEVIYSAAGSEKNIEELYDFISWKNEVEKDLAVHASVFSVEKCNAEGKSVAVYSFTVKDEQFSIKTPVSGVLYEK